MLTKDVKSERGEQWKWILYANNIGERDVVGYYHISHEKEAREERQEDRERRLEEKEGWNIENGRWRTDKGG